MMKKDQILCSNIKTGTNKLMNADIINKRLEAKKLVYTGNLIINKQNPHIFYTRPNACINAKGNLIPSPERYGLDTEGNFTGSRYGTIAVYYLNGTLLKVFPTVTKVSQYLAINGPAVSREMRISTKGRPAVVGGWLIKRFAKKDLIPFRTLPVKQEDFVRRNHPTLFVKDSNVTRYLNTVDAADEHYTGSIDTLRRKLKDPKGVEVVGGGKLYSEVAVASTISLNPTTIILNKFKSVELKITKGISHSKITDASKREMSADTVKENLAPTKETAATASPKTASVSTKEESSKKEDPRSGSMDRGVIENKSVPQEHYTFRSMEGVGAIKLRDGDTVDMFNTTYTATDITIYVPENYQEMFILSGINKDMALVREKKTVIEKSSFMSTFKAFFGFK